MHFYTLNLKCKSCDTVLFICFENKQDLQKKEKDSLCTHLSYMRKKNKLFIKILSLSYAVFPQSIYLHTVRVTNICTFQLMNNMYNVLIYNLPTFNFNLCIIMESEQPDFYPTNKNKKRDFKNSIFDVQQQ